VRKHYQHGDLPAGYQVTMNEKPIGQGGEWKGWKIRQVHMEQDTAQKRNEKSKQLHESTDNNPHNENSQEDGYKYERANAPLLEIVTEPKEATIQETVQFCRDIQTLLRDHDIADGRMDQGEFRIDVNYSQKPHIYRAEVKNLNSFKAVQHAIGNKLKLIKHLVSCC